MALISHATSHAPWETDSLETGICCVYSGGGLILRLSGAPPTNLPKDFSMADKNSPLQAVAEGKKITDKQAHSALGQAVDKIAGLTKRAKVSKENVMETGVLVLHTAETQGTLFLASMAEGYLGTEKMKVGGLDLRAPAGLLLGGYGLYETLSGGKGGGHALALGNGIMGSWLASVGVNAGRTLAEKKSGGSPQPAAMPVPTSNMRGEYLLEGPSFIPEIPFAGPEREVMLTPESSASGDEEMATEGRFRPAGRRRMGPGARRARPNRFRPEEEEEGEA
jgi:hypothetical protein